MPIIFMVWVGLSYGY